MIPFRPLLQRGKEPFSMFQDLWKKYEEWVFPPLTYTSASDLMEVFKVAVINPALERQQKLRKKKAKPMPMEDTADYREKSTKRRGKEK